MKHNFVAKEGCMLIKAISDNIAGLNKPAIKFLIKKGEVRINGDKQLTDCEVRMGDEVSVFLPQRFESAKPPDIIYADKNILIADKPAGYDVEHNLLDYILKDYPSALPVHRLDRGTSGLVIFALNGEAQNILFDAFKQQLIEKTYLAKVSGRVENEGVFTAYLFKDPKKGEVKISDTFKRGYKQIKTGIEIVSTSSKSSVLRVRLFTGRTHQIRAHLAHLGHAVLGDAKYGDEKKSGVYMLCAHQIRILSLSGSLSYLSQKVFVSSKANIID